MIPSPRELETAKFNLETSTIAWRELQRFFAGGLAIAIDARLDLVEVAYEFSVDNKKQVTEWLTSGLIAHVSDQQALAWIENDTEVWAVVVKPWVLVQDKSSIALER